MLCARGDVQGILDETGLVKCLGPDLNIDFAQLSVNLDWGVEKEPHALHSFCQLVMTQNPSMATCTLQQRGFMAANTRLSHR